MTRVVCCYILNLKATVNHWVQEYDSKRIPMIIIVVNKEIKKCSPSILFNNTYRFNKLLLLTLIVTLYTIINYDIFNEYDSIQ